MALQVEARLGQQTIGLNNLARYNKVTGHSRIQENKATRQEGCVFRPRVIVCHNQEPHEGRFEQLDLEPKEDVTASDWCLN